MNPRLAVFAGLCLLCSPMSSRPDAVVASPPENETLLREQKHFLECLAYGYDPALWVSYKGELYFMPKDDLQVRRIEQMKAERADYLSFTNLQSRHTFASNVLAATSLSENWRRRLVLPWSATNENLMPVLNRAWRSVPSYTLLQTLRGGDALLQENNIIYFVMEYGRAAADMFCTNGILVYEGTKTYRTVAGVSKTVDAFTDAGLSKEEIEVLNGVVTSLRLKAAALGRDLAGIEAKRAFEEHRSRAGDGNPYMEYLLARDYLDGTGTEKNETLGLQWMNKAAHDGSGDAAAFLTNRNAKPP